MNKKEIHIKYDQEVNSINSYINVVKNKGTALKVVVDTSKQDIDEVLTELIKCGKVKDITISEPPLEEIISLIYQQNRGVSDEGI